MRRRLLITLARCLCAMLTTAMRSRMGGTGETLLSYTPPARAPGARWQQKTRYIWHVWTATTPFPLFLHPTVLCSWALDRR